jgi:hypothetical protein
VSRRGPILLGILAACVLAGCSHAATTPRAERHLVWTAGSGDPWESWVVIAQVDGTHPRRLARGSGASLSPDGHWIAFSGCQNRRRCADGEEGPDLFVMRTAGGRARLVLRDGAGAVWFPDSRRFLTWRAATLVAADVDGNTKRIAERVGFATISPDGHRIAYDVSTANRSTCGDSRDVLYVARPNGSGRRRLTRGNGPVWGSREIAFARPSRGCGITTVWGIRPDGAGAHPLAPPLPREFRTLGYYGLTPDRWLGEQRLVTLLWNEWGAEAVTLDLTTRTLRRRRMFVDDVSRDGRWIVGTQGGAEFPYTILLARLDGGTTRTIAHGQVCCADWNR